MENEIRFCFRDWRAERGRLPLMRQHYETMLAETGLPLILQSFADSFWQACLISGVSPDIELGVKARAKLVFAFIC